MWINLTKLMTNFNRFSGLFITVNLFLISIIFCSKPTLLIVGNLTKNYFFTRIPNGLLIHSLELYYNILILEFSFVLSVYLIISILYGIIKICVYYSLFNLGKWEIRLYYCMILGMIPISVFSVVIFFNYELSISFADISTALFEQKYNQNSIIYYKLCNIYTDYFNFCIVIIAKFILGYLRSTLILYELNLKSVDIKVLAKVNMKSFPFYEFCVASAITLFTILYVNYVMEYISFSLKIQPFKNNYEFTLYSVLNLNNLGHNILIASVLSILIFGSLNYLLKLYLDNQTYYDKMYPFLNNTHIDTKKLLNAFVSISLSFGYYGLFCSGLVLCTHYIPSGYIIIGKTF